MTNNNSDKLISGLTARKYLKCTKTGGESRVEQGIIQAYRDEEMRWRVSKDSVMGYLRQRHRAGETRLVLEDHYQEVVMRICAAKKRIRNHAKVMIIDDEMAYIGSANVTPAGLGQGVRSPGNFEAGILTENREMTLEIGTS